MSSPRQRGGLPVKHRRVDDGQHGELAHRALALDLEPLRDAVAVEGVPTGQGLRWWPPSQLRETDGAGRRLHATAVVVTTAARKFLQVPPGGPNFLDPPQKSLARGEVCLRGTGCRTRFCPLGYTLQRTFCPRHPYRGGNSAPRPEKFSKSFWEGPNFFAASDFFRTAGRIVAAAEWRTRFCPLGCTLQRTICPRHPYRGGNSAPRPEKFSKSFWEGPNFFAASDFFRTAGRIVAAAEWRTRFCPLGCTLQRTICPRHPYRGGNSAPRPEKFSKKFLGGPQLFCGE